MDLFLTNMIFIIIIIIIILLHKTLIDGLESRGVPVHYCDAFISCLNSHSDGTHSLLWIHW